MATIMFSRKQRADIYLEAAKSEVNEYRSSIWKLRYATGINRSIENMFPEILLFNNTPVKFKSKKELSNIRILALLFAREIALNP